MNCENTEMETEEDVANQRMTNTFCEEDVYMKLQEERNLEAWADKIPVEAWACMGKFGIQLLRRPLNSLLNTEKNGDEEYWCQLLRGQECKNYRGITLLAHTFKLWEEELNKRLTE